MANQLCIMCKKEFTPCNDGRPHYYCCSSCRRQHDKYKREVSAQYREELGLPPQVGIAGNAVKQERACKDKKNNLE